MVNVNAQEWLDKEYPQDKKASIAKLNISNKNLEGSLKLEGFANIREFNCSDNYLTSLDCSQNNGLTKIDCHNNKITKICLPEKSASLTHLDLDSNNFPKSSLFFVSKFISLEELKVGNHHKHEEIGKVDGVYNRFQGSLKYLKNLKRLSYLSIPATDIDAGLEYLPDTVEKFFCRDRGKDVKVKNIYEQLKPFKDKRGQKEEDKPFTKEDIQAWKEDYKQNSTRLLQKIEELESANERLERELAETRQRFEQQMRDLQIQSEKKIQQTKNELQADHQRQISAFQQQQEQLRREAESRHADAIKEAKSAAEQQMRLVQDQLRQAKEEADRVRRDLEAKSSSSSSEIAYQTQQLRTEEKEREEAREKVNKGKEKLEEQLRHQESDETQKFLNNNYSEDERWEVEELDISNENLTGELDLSKFTNLKKLNCSHNQLTSLKLNNNLDLLYLDCSHNCLNKLDLSKNSKLVGLDCSFNDLEELIAVNSCPHLEMLICNDNKLSNNLSELLPKLDESEGSSKLACLNINNNNIQGNLPDLEKFTNLEFLWIGGENNNFSNSSEFLENLKKMTKLESLDISDTGVEVKSEHLPDGIREIRHSDKETLDEKLKTKKGLEVVSAEKITNKELKSKLEAANKKIKNLENKSIEELCVERLKNERSRVRAVQLAVDYGLIPIINGERTLRGWIWR